MTTIDGLRGAAIVTRAGAVECEVADGSADVAAGQVCTPQTRFQIASISKQFAAIAVMLLVESGDVALDASVLTWIPDAPPQWSAITLHHLLSHTSGLRHWDDTPGFRPAEPMSAERRLELFTEAPLRTDVGAEWHYSSPGYVIVGSIVARASGRPYPTFVTDRILKPLALTSTTMGAAPSDSPVAHGYRDGEPVVPFDLGSMPGTGDVVSTVADLARFTTALHGGAILTEASVQTMCTSHASLVGVAGADDGWSRTDGYGYGHYIGDLGGERAVYHPGDNPGFMSINVWLPEHRAAIVVLVNDESADLDHILKQLLPIAVTADPAR